MWLVGWLGCVASTDGDRRRPPEPWVPPDPPDTTFTVPTDDSAHSGHTGGAPTGDSGLPDPCALVPRVPKGVRAVSAVPTSEEFAFDAVGNVVNATEASGVSITDFAGAGTVVSPGGSWEYAGIRITPDGAKATLCDEGRGTIQQVDLATGAREDVLSIPGPNSIGWDVHGRLWIGSNSQLLRFDPAVGGSPTVVVDRPGADIDGVTFSPDFLTVYFNDDTGGDIGRVDLDADGEVIGGSVHASLAGVFAGGGELDGMTTDVCGNLYVVRTNGELTRIWSDGTEQRLVAATGNWTTAVSFGSGVGGWERDRLYVMDRVNGLWELDVGVEGRPEPHLP
jgi:hypothetical protein